MKKILFLTPVFFILFYSCTRLEYKKIRGFIYGTTYSITYEINTNENLINDIQDLMYKFDSSLSTYNPESVISKVNMNDPNVIPDDYFIYCFNKAKIISDKTAGSFDMTVAPIVNAWGFGFTEKTSNTDINIDSLLDFVGYQKVRLENNRIIKDDPRVMLDASAIAKGYSVDVISQFLDDRNIKNYMVEIGGEIRIKGINPERKNWQVGLDKPIENLEERELFSVISISNTSMASSGNYRQFYVENGVKYSHTINPHTGYPAKNKLLSVTVFANECLVADAYATAFMVMGLEKSISFSEKEPDLNVYLIYSDKNGEFQTYASEEIKELITDL